MKTKESAEKFIKIALELIYREKIEFSILNFLTIDYLIINFSIVPNRALIKINF